MDRFYISTPHIGSCPATRVAWYVTWWSESREPGGPSDSLVGRMQLAVDAQMPSVIDPRREGLEDGVQWSGERMVGLDGT